MRAVVTTAMGVVDYDAAHFGRYVAPARADLGPSQDGRTMDKPFRSTCLQPGVFCFQAYTQSFSSIHLHLLTQKHRAEALRQCIMQRQHCGNFLSQPTSAKGHFKFSLDPERSSPDSERSNDLRVPPVVPMYPDPFPSLGF